MTQWLICFVDVTSIKSNNDVKLMRSSVHKQFRKKKQVLQKPHPENVCIKIQDSYHVFDTTLTVTSWSFLPNYWFSFYETITLRRKQPVMFTEISLMIRLIDLIRLINLEFSSNYLGFFLLPFRVFP